MFNYYFKDTIESFLQKNTTEIIGSLTLSNQFDSTVNQNDSWNQQIGILKKALHGFVGTIYFEFYIPRMGKRVDTIVIIENVVFVIEFKVGEKEFKASNIDQVWDYALDLKNFHQPSHNVVLAPILVATEAKKSFIEILKTHYHETLIAPIKTNKDDLDLALKKVLLFVDHGEPISSEEYESGSYSPTPTIIEAAVALYNSHSVEDITRSDADATNLTQTTSAISSTIDYAKGENKKVICFVTGVPGAGKTLVGLDVATSHLDKEKGNTRVYLSGNGPLVEILQEALARNKVDRSKANGKKMKISEARQAVKPFIQNVHHYRDAYLRDKKPPYEHVAIFDEAQRAWNKDQTIKFMKNRKKLPDFHYSEPEFLISCLDRHKDWAVVICLVGGGQEINKGEAGISEWLNAIQSNFSEWEVHISPNLKDSEYAAVDVIDSLPRESIVKFNDDLHLSVSMRSFRAENLSLFVRHLLDRDLESAKNVLASISKNYPIVLTRCLSQAKQWLKKHAGGNERYGLIVSSQAQRLRPFAIDVKSPLKPVNWFLNAKDDVRSSFYLEDAATEFHVQGLELDWSCVVWDGDLRYSKADWKTFAFKGSNWQNVKVPDRKKYLVNAYRVLLTRARQGMVIVVPEGCDEDHTRKHEYYDSTFEYLKMIGIDILE